MKYEDIAADFVERTRRNLQAARRLPSYGDDPFYDFTHLINSLLGLIVVPDQRMQDRLPPSTFDELQADGWGLDVLSETEPGPSDLRALIHGMRNAVAHFRLEPLANEVTREIESVTLWNTNYAGTVRRWGVRFNLSELNSFVERLAAVLQTAIRQP